MDRDLPPHAVAHAADATLDDLRNWRRAGFMNGFGTRVGKANLYSRQEAFRVALSRLLGRSVGLHAGFVIVQDSARFFDALVGAPPRPRDTYFTIGLDPDFSDGYSRAYPGRAHTLDFSRTPLGVLEVNVSAVLRRVEERLADWELQNEDEEG